MDFKVFADEIAKAMEKLALEQNRPVKELVNEGKEMYERVVENERRFIKND